MKKHINYKIKIQRVGSFFSFEIKFGYTQIITVKNQLSKISINKFKNDFIYHNSINCQAITTPKQHQIKLYIEIGICNC